MSHYDTDFYGWTQHQAALLREGRLDAADIANIAEEIESLGKSEKRELESRLIVLLVHLLKWAYEPHRRSASWRLTIEEQRRAVAKVMRDNPSLRPRLPEVIDDAYYTALIRAERETQLPRTTFPPACPWAFESLMDDGFWPERVS